jgi:cytochrome P450
MDPHPFTPLFSDEARRDPYPLYAQVRAASPLLRGPQTRNLWMVFDYDGVNRVLSDHEAFSSRHGPADWMIFTDPPRHSKLRALVSRAFTPKSVASLEPRIRELSRGLLDAVLGRGEMDVADDFAIPLPMLVIGEMLGIPAEDRPRFYRWNNAILKMSYLVPVGKSPETAGVMQEFIAVTAEMGDYLADLLGRRRTEPKDDLITRLGQAEVDGERLSPTDILGFFQLLLLAGAETTTNLINNAVLCFIRHPEELARLEANPGLLPSAVEEVLRYRSPLQWMFRLARREVEMHGRTIPSGALVLAMIGSANHDPKQFHDPARFDVARDPNPHLAFGHGIHFCLGAPLARLEAKIALGDFLARIKHFRLASDEPWEPRKGLHVHGPTRLPIRFHAEN